MSLRQQLKVATQPYHDQTEQLSGPSAPFTLDDYRTFLRTGWLFHSSLEKSVTDFLSPSLKEALRWSDRLKTSWIAQDLHELGVDPAASLSPLPFPVDTVPQALGALYVAEGSTLGGMMMKKMWEADPLIGPHSSFCFLGCYGKQTSAYWKSFIAVLESTVTEPSDEVETIASAKSTFEFYQTCHRRVIAAGAVFANVLTVSRRQRGRYHDGRRNHARQQTQDEPKRGARWGGSPWLSAARRAVPVKARS